MVLLAAPIRGAPSAKSYAESFGYHYNPIAAQAPLVSPSSQFFARDEAGQYNYGYSGPLSSKQEVKSADGVTRGSYSYVDANGLIQRVDYVSDILGFRVAATNLPKAEVPAVATAVQAEVAEAPAVEAVAYTDAKVQAVPAEKVVAAQVASSGVPVVPAYRPMVLAPTVAYTYLPYASNYGYYFTPGLQVGQTNLQVPVSQPIQTAEVKSVPLQPVAAAVPVAQAEVDLRQSDVVEVGVADAPAVVQAPVVPIQSQYHAQDEFGQYNFGYQEPNSARQEVKTADGIIRGSYNYVDDQGKIQTVEYVADEDGFRAAGTTIPVQEVLVPAPVQETPEVAEARAEHARLFAETAARNAELAELALAQQAEIAAAAAPVVSEPAAVAAPAVVPVGQAPAVVVAPVAPTSSQYHAQDELGQYNYGYSNEESTKVETRTSDGIVRGAYRYVDGEGKYYYNLYNTHHFQSCTQLKLFFIILLPNLEGLLNDFVIGLLQARSRLCSTSLTPLAFALPPPTSQPMWWAKRGPPQKPPLSRFRRSRWWSAPPPSSRPRSPPSSPRR